MHDYDNPANVAVHDQPDVVTAPKLAPFLKNPPCPKCGLGVSRIERMVKGSGICAVDTHYCPGGKNEKEHAHPLPGMTVEVQMNCFGLFEEHLHRRCRACGYAWLMETKK